MKNRTKLVREKRGKTLIKHDWMHFQEFRKTRTLMKIITQNTKNNEFD
jgi:hypothetical protein